MIELQGKLSEAAALVDNLNATVLARDADIATLQGNLDTANDNIRLLQVRSPAGVAFSADSEAVGAASCLDAGRLPIQHAGLATFASILFGTGDQRKPTHPRFAMHRQRDSDNTCLFGILFETAPHTVLFAFASPHMLHRQPETGDACLSGTLSDDCKNNDKHDDYCTVFRPFFLFAPQTLHRQEEADNAKLNKTLASTQKELDATKYALAVSRANEGAVERRYQVRAACLSCNQVVSSCCFVNMSFVDGLW